MTKDEILKRYEDDNEYHFHQLDREWVLDAMQEYADEQLKLSVVSNNEAFKCELCKDTGIYFFSDRIPEDCKCKSEVAVCPNCKGTGKDGHDRCYPPNWYVCKICNGSGQTDY